MTNEEFSQRVEKLRKLTEIDRPVKEKDGWSFGERVTPLEDDEEHGIYTGTDGYLILEEVGGEEYGNLQVKAYYLEDEMDAVNEISLYNIEALSG